MVSIRIVTNVKMGCSDCHNNNIPQKICSIIDSYMDGRSSNLEHICSCAKKNV